MWSGEGWATIKHRIAAKFEEVKAGIFGSLDRLESVGFLNDKLALTSKMGIEATQRVALCAYYTIITLGNNYPL